MNKYHEQSKLKNLSYSIKQYILNNIKSYCLILVIFIIGIFIGVLFINNLSSANENIIIDYITEFIQNFQGMEEVDKTSLLADSVKNNMILAIIVWFAGTTIIGIPIVLGLILFRGFCLGYTISAITLTLGQAKGIIFSLLLVCLQNIFFIPAFLTIGVSSVKLYRNIMKDKRRENIKIEIIRHTIVSIIMLGILIFSSFIESTVSLKLLKLMIRYFNIN